MLDLQLFLPSRVGVIWHGERHPEVSADHVDDRLPVAGIGLPEPGERVEPAEPDRRRFRPTPMLSCAALHRGHPNEDRRPVSSRPWRCSSRWRLSWPRTARGTGCVGMYTRLPEQDLQTLTRNRLLHPLSR